VVSLKELVIGSIVVGLFVFCISYVFVDVANNYGFSNETDSNFMALDQASQVYDEIESAKELAQSTNPAMQLIELVLMNGYLALTIFFSLPTTLITLADNLLLLLGVPPAVNFYVYAMITAFGLFMVLKAVGVFKENT